MPGKDYASIKVAELAAGSFKCSDQCHVISLVCATRFEFVQRFEELLRIFMFESRMTVKQKQNRNMRLKGNTNTKARNFRVYLVLFSSYAKNDHLLEMSQYSFSFRVLVMMITLCLATALCKFRLVS